MTEQWKPVSGYEGLYEVSNLGNVRSTERTLSCVSRWGSQANRKYSQSMLNKHLIGDGYYAVVLSNRGEKKTKYVHRLVADAFCEKEEGKNIVHHKDENKQNNCYLNLEWTDYFGNLHCSIGSYKHSHNAPLPSTGYKYICKTKSGRREYFKVRVGKFQKTCKTIEEALSAREVFLNAK